MSGLSKYKSENVDQLTTYLVRQFNPATAWNNVISSYSMIPGLVAMWPFTYTDATGDALSMGSVSKNLMRIGSATGSSYNQDVLMPYVQLDGNAALERNDEADLSIQGDEEHIASSLRGFTFLCWTFFDNAAGSDEAIMAKWRSSGNRRSYRLRRQTSGVISFSVSSNGGDQFLVDSVNIPPTGEWVFVAGRFVPSTEIAVFVNDAIETDTASIPTTIHDSPADFFIGAQATGSASELSGRVALATIVSAALPDEFILSLFDYGRPLVNLKVF